MFGSFIRHSSIATSFYSIQDMPCVILARHVLQASRVRAYSRRIWEDYDDHQRERMENPMSMQSEGNNAKGRNYDQVTKDGTSSAGTLGVGGTGTGTGTNAQSDTGGNLQKGRADDLLSNDADRDSEGFVGEEAGELQTGLGGIGSLSTGNAGSRQSDDKAKE
jgi:hypothetical protein